MALPRHLYPRRTGQWGRAQRHGDHLPRQLSSQAAELEGTPYALAPTPKSRSELYGSEDSAKIVSMHSSKGLEFGPMLIPGLDEMPKKGETEADEALLLYVPMTRAIDRLVMTYWIIRILRDGCRKHCWARGGLEVGSCE